MRKKHSETSYEKHSIKKQRLDTQVTQQKELLSSTEALVNVGAIGSPQTAKSSNEASTSANVTPIRKDTKRLLTPSEQTGTPPGVITQTPVYNCPYCEFTGPYRTVYHHKRRHRDPPFSSQDFWPDSVVKKEDFQSPVPVPETVEIDHEHLGQLDENAVYISRLETEIEKLKKQLEQKDTIIQTYLRFASE